MYRHKRKFKYQEGDILIKSAGISEEVGLWALYDPEIKMRYIGTNDSSTHIYQMLNKKFLIGYFAASVCFGNSKKSLILDDLAVISRKYAAHTKVLITALIKLASVIECQEIKIENNSKYQFFLAFLKRHFKVIEQENNLIINIRNSKISSEKYLCHFNDDYISLNDLCFLYDLKFRIGKEKCVINLPNNETMTINRKNGIVTFPSNVINFQNVYQFNSTSKALIHLICYNYSIGNCSQIELNKKVDEIIIACSIDDTIYYFGDLKEVENNFALFYALNQKTQYKEFLEYSINYDGSTFTTIVSGWKIEEKLKKLKLLLDVYPQSLKEYKELLLKVNDYKLKMDELLMFDFRFGNSFCGIKKLNITFSEEVEVKSNGSLEKEIEVNREVILKELKALYFCNWQNKYIKENPILENAWTITLVFPNQTLIYGGIDLYPTIWPYVIEFVEKYSKFKVHDDFDE